MTEYVTVWRDHEPTKMHWGVPVVRCGDCKRFSGYELEPHFGYCERYDLHEVRGNGFCAWGERRDA